MMIVSFLCVQLSSRPIEISSTIDALSTNKIAHLTQTMKVVTNQKENLRCVNERDG